jgi:cell division protein FtsB
VLGYLLLAGAGVLMVNALVGENGYLAGLRARRDYNAVMTDLVKIRLENQQLREQARRLKDDPSAIEDSARRELGLIRPGETLVIIRDAAKKDDR